MKIKILYLIPSLTLGGAEKLLVNHLNLIDNEIYECQLIIVGKKTRSCLSDN